MDIYARKDGYDYEFITPPEPRYECPICLLVLKEPYQTKCGHRFCRDCIMKSLRESSRRCPVDNTILTDNDVYPDNFAKREILNFGIKCPNCNAGCDKIILLGKLQNHLEECSFALVSCPLMCTCEIQRWELNNHVTRSCENRQITCDYCCQSFQAKVIKDHTDVCPMAIVVCPHCSEKHISSRMEYHVHNDCKKVEVYCPFYILGCSKMMVRSMVDEHLILFGSAHLKQLCHAVTFLAHELHITDSLSPMSAKNIFQNINLTQRITHESSADSTNSDKNGNRSENVDTNMPYNFISALPDLTFQRLENEIERENTFKLSFAKKQLPVGGLFNGHYNNSQPAYHPHNCFDCVTGESERHGLSNQKMTSKHAVCKHFQSQSPQQSSATGNDKSEHSSLLLNVPSMEEYIPDNLDVINVIKQITCRFQKREAVLQKNFEELQKKFIAIEQSYCGLIETVKNLEQRVVESNLQFVNGDFCWCINNFSQYRLKLEAGESSMLHSSPFYTSPWGYKMCVRASIDMCSQKKMQLSLFVHFMKGKNDAFLTWPFTGRIIMSVLDQNSDASRRYHIRDTLEANPNMDAFQRPTTPRNHKGFGYVHFVSISTLENGTYLMDDTLVIRVQVYTPNCP